MVELAFDGSLLSGVCKVAVPGHCGSVVLGTNSIVLIEDRLLPVGHADAIALPIGAGTGGLTGGS